MPHLDPQPRHLDRERRRREDAVAAGLGARAASGRAGACAVRVSSRRDLTAGSRIVRQLHELARRHRRALRSREPEAELGERVAERLREHAADLLRRAAAVAHLVLERAHEAHALVPRPPVPPVDDVLDARAQRPERERDDERRRARRPTTSRRRRATPRPTVIAAYDAEQQECQRRVDESAVDDPLDRVQPVAEHGDPDRGRDRHLHQQEEGEDDSVDERRRSSSRRARTGRVRAESAQPTRRATSSAAARPRSTAEAGGSSRRRRR